ncbi:DUF397 domain-containing protein [Streptomonospora nanhaiensis]|uniref:DUF397 domain-containing protein n=1 Tax=Streptomonospora nanhaiensis TaxID=1323731 RepID=UPI001C3958A8|nr:DUF397 domain-containing protein [Streptomonospora nanhaiensis]MBV2366273.1 DUF397 domain-containing protein [Streptomonospora nanhaiensis]
MDTQWRKSSYSQVRGDCVEARLADEGVVALMRDTRNRDKGTLAFPKEEWAAFLADVDSL